MNVCKRMWSALAGLALLGAGLAATTGVRFTIDGRPVEGALNVDGRLYVPVSALRNAGLNITGGPAGVQLATGGTGGANQMTALEGCVNQTLFNGVWRMRVTGSQAGDVSGTPGWRVTAELRNGTPRPQFVYSTGLAVQPGAYTLATAAGDTGAWRLDGASTGNTFANRHVPQGGAFTFTFAFVPRETGQRPPTPAKFLMRVDTSYVDRKEVAYTVPDPSFRIDLTCRK